jgi:DNA-binding HxlR family transcriptional regulator
MDLPDLVGGRAGRHVPSQAATPVRPQPWFAAVSASSLLPEPVKVIAGLLAANGPEGERQFHNLRRNLHSLTRTLLAQRSGQSERTVARHLARLEADGWLVRHAQGWRAHQPEFHLTRPGQEGRCPACRCGKGDRKGDSKKGDKGDRSLSPLSVLMGNGSEHENGSSSATSDVSSAAAAGPPVAGRSDEPIFEEDTMPSEIEVQDGEPDDSLVEHDRAGEPDAMSSEVEPPRPCEICEGLGWHWSCGACRCGLVERCPDCGGQCVPHEGCPEHDAVTVTNDDSAVVDGERFPDSGGRAERGA